MANATTNPAGSPAEPEPHLLARVEAHLRAGKPADALALLSGPGSPWVQNARAVCLLRLGRPNEAVVALRELVFDKNGLALRADADPLFLANYATALLLDGNQEGFFSILGSIRDRTHPAVVKLTDAVRRWKAGMTFGQRVRSALGGGPPFALNVPPGEL